MYNLTNENIKSLIHIVRGQKVMFDFELAPIYGYSTVRFNEQIKNNIKKFDRFSRFKLTKNEWTKILVSKKSISSWGGRRIPPYAFTETGIYMLMTVLKGELATKQTKLLINAFKAMKDYIIENEGITVLTNAVKLNSLRIDKVEKQLDVVMDNFIDNYVNKHYLILDGQKIEADIAYQTIYESAKEKIFVIDDYINIKTLQLLKSSNNKIEIIIFSDNKAKNNLTQNYLNDFISDTRANLKLIRTMNKIHDRYIIIDYNSKNERIYHCGTSSKDAGNKITTISLLEDVNIYKPIIDNLLLNKKLELK